MANISNINNVLRTGSTGIGINCDPEFTLDVERSSASAVLSLNSVGGSGAEYLIFSGTDGSLTFNKRYVGDRLYIASGGNIGIGTSNPASILHVHGTQSYGSFRLSPSATNSESSMGFFMDTAGTTTGTAWIIGQGGWSNQGDFVIGNQAFGGPVILVQQDGNVGIGTTSPAALLDVSSGTTTDVIRFGANSRWGFSRANSDNRYLSFMRNQNGSGTAVWTVDGDNGTVGIGTTLPATKLQVAHAGEVIVRSSMTAADGYRGGFEADNQHTGGTIWSMFSTNNSDGYFGGGKFVIANESMGGVDVNTTGKFIIDGSGNVTIDNTVSGDAILTLATTTGGDPTIIMNSDAANRSGLIKYQDAGTNVGRIEYVHNGDKIDIQAGSATSYTTQITNGCLTTKAAGASNSILAQWQGTNANNCATFRTTDSGYIFRIHAQNSGTIYVQNDDGSNYLKIPDSGSNEVSGNTTFTGTITSNGGAATINNGGSVAAYFNGTGSSYTQGAIAIQSSNADTPEARGQGVFMFNQGKDSTWYMGTRYNNADEWQIGRVAGTSFDTAAATTANNFVKIDNTGATTFASNFHTTARAAVGTTPHATIKFDVLSTATDWTARIKNYTNSGYGLAVDCSGATASTTYTLAAYSASGGGLFVRNDDKVGINSTSPAALLEISGDGDAIRVESLNTGNSGAQIDLLHFTTSPADGDINGMINFGGYYTGTTSSYATSIRSVWYDVSAQKGDIQFFARDGGSFVERMKLQHTGNLHVDGDVVAYSTSVSDIRLKDNVKPLKNSLNKIINLKGVEYIWNNGSRKGQKDIGFIAQEVENVIPEIVRENEVLFDKNTKYKTIDYEKITAVLVEAMKELKAEIEELKKHSCDCKK